MTNESSEVVIVWVGRFIHNSGYGSATRSIYQALKENGINIVGVDSFTGQPIDDAGERYFDIDKNDDGFELKAKSPDIRIVCVTHELPTEWNRVEVSGRAHSIGYTVSETAEIPFGWSYEMLAQDQIWIATDFNKQVLVKEGIPESMITTIPHALNAEAYVPRETPLKMAHANAFRFLNITGGIDRKDCPGLIRSYASTFTADDDVSLVLKLSNRMKPADFEEFILKQLQPWVDLHDEQMPHIMFINEMLSDEQIVDLYASSHCYVSTERGKGWDLPSCEAMLMGLPTVGINWGGNKEFQNHSNSYLVEPSRRNSFAAKHLVKNEGLYTGHTWANFDVLEFGKAMRDVYENYEKEKEKALLGRPELVSNLSYEVVSKKVEDYISQLEGFRFRSNNAATIRILKSGSSKIKGRDKRRFTSARKLPEDALDVINNKYDPKEDLDEWVMEKRKVWGKFGPVLQSYNETNRNLKLKNSFLGESIFLVGNGPSLNKLDMDKLCNYYSFAANKIYLLYDKVKWRPDFYTVLDWRVTPDHYENVNSLEDGIKFFPNRFHGLLREGEDVHWYESLSPGKSILDRFEPDMNRGIFGGGTVITAAIQIAYYLGFRKMFLIGTDVSYTIPKSVTQSGGDRFGTGTQINLLSKRDDDPNHFDKSYFGKGARWHDPNVDGMLRGFRDSRRALDYFGAEIYNSTPGGNLNCIERMAFDDALKYAKKKNG